MKIGIIGLARSGKTTIFEALTSQTSDAAHKGESRVGTIRVPDQRLDVLNNMYKPPKAVYAQVEYFLPGLLGQTIKDQSPWRQVRYCDALIQVVRNFGGFGFEDPTPRQDFQALQQELIIDDLVVVEKRIERLGQDHKRGKKADPEELRLLHECKEALENEIPLRKKPHLASAPTLKGFTLLSAKPVLALFNNPDDDDNPPAEEQLTSSEEYIVLRGKLERELSQMSDEEAGDFLEEFNLTALAADRVIKRSYELLGLISFFTVGDDEVRAWTISKGRPAVEAAGAIHTDMQKGFIRAEVVAYDHLIEAGNYPEARKKGVVRLEGKTYEVKDGDIIEFRFNV